MGNTPKSAMKKLAVLQAEAALDTGTTTVTCRDHKLTFRALGDWDIDCLEDLADNKFRAWASGALTPESFELWLEIRPTLNEVIAMLTEYTDATGTDLGK